MNKQQLNQKNWKQQSILYTVFVILVIVGMVMLSGEYISIKKENNLLKQAVMENQNLAEYRLTSITRLWNQLNECKQELNG